MNRWCTKAQLMKKWWSSNKNTFAVSEKFWFIYYLSRSKYCLKIIMFQCIYGTFAEVCSDVSQQKQAVFNSGIKLNMMASLNLPQECCYHFNHKTPSVCKHHGASILTGIRVREEGLLFHHPNASFKSPNTMCLQRRNFIPKMATVIP